MLPSQWNETMREKHILKSMASLEQQIVSTRYSILFYYAIVAIYYFITYLCFNLCMNRSKSQSARKSLGNLYILYYLLSTYVIILLSF